MPFGSALRMTFVSALWMAPDDLVLTNLSFEIMVVFTSIKSINPLMSDI